MKFAKLFIPGAYEDAFLYKKSLVAVTEEKTVDIYDFKKIVEDIGESVSLDATFLPMMFLQNDWFYTPQFKTFMSSDLIQSTFLDFIEALPDPIEIPNANQFIQLKEDIATELKAILDLSLIHI